MTTANAHQQPLPEYVQISIKQDNGIDLDPVERFIADNEPAWPYEAEFRLQLRAALQHAAKQALAGREGSVASNNYRRILAALGMVDDGDPAAEVRRLVALAVAWPGSRQAAQPAPTEPSRSQKMAAAGFTPRDTRIECDDCGAKCTPQFLPIHKCDENRGERERFELQMEKDGDPVGPKNSRGEYRWSSDSVAWRTWQSRAALAAQPTSLKECRHCGFLCAPNPGEQARPWYPLGHAAQPAAPADVLAEAMRLAGDHAHAFATQVGLYPASYPEADQAVVSSEDALRSYLAQHLSAQPAAAPSDRLRESAQDHIDSLDAYGGQLVPINRKGGTARALREALRAQPAAAPDGWQPIETAPKDGTEVILRRGNRVGAAMWVWYIDSDSDNERCEGWTVGFDGDSWDDDLSPTHWQPLPAAPGCKGGAQCE